ncbi:MAG TPA: c-type cytochrome biogenesis protein CcmI [Pyrinomonadaceae bacterium]|jgi:cytochrome c-type biogenesis protein CcmH
MMSFLIFAALLVAIALCYVLPPLLQRAEDAPDEERVRANVSIYRDQFAELDRDLRDGVIDREQCEQGRTELQRRLLEDVASQPATSAADKSSARGGRTAAIIVGAAVPLLAVVLYPLFGTLKALGPGQPVAPSRPAEAEVAGAPMMGGGQPGTPTQQQIEARVAKLAERLKENPNDAQGWAMLARSYQNFKHYKEASEAYQRAAELTGNDADLWADYAETLALANGSELKGRPLEIINKALELDPQNQKALWLAGDAAFQAQDFRQAVSYWERLQQLLPADSDAAQGVSASLDEARARLK